MERASQPNLEALTRHFDDTLVRMHGKAGARAMADALSMDPAELGEAAVVQAAGEGAGESRKWTLHHPKRG